MMGMKYLIAIFESEYFKMRRVAIFGLNLLNSKKKVLIEIYQINLSKIIRCYRINEVFRAMKIKKFVVSLTVFKLAYSLAVFS